MTYRHRTAREKAAQQSAQTAIARAHAHTQPPAPADPTDPTDEDLGRRYPYVTSARARQIRHQIEEHRRHA